MTTTTSSLKSFRPIHGFQNIQIVDTEEQQHQGIDDTSHWKWYCPPGVDSQEKIGAVGGGSNDNSNYSNDPSKLGWWKLVGNDGETSAEETKSSSLHIAPPAKRDFWRKTYYEPLLVKDDGPFLYTVLSFDQLPATIETSFTITNPQSQFDQAGIIIRYDHEHWIKTGIEVVDNIPRLSCVVTNGFSDWSTQPWTSSSSSSSKTVEPKLRLRVHLLPQHGGSFVVEAAPLNLDDGGATNSTSDWSLVRICHMNPNMNHTLLNNHETVRNAYQGISAPSNSIMVGVFAACPIDQDGSCVTKFHDISVTPGSSFVHTA